MIHEAGYIYNDLKLDNIVIGDDKTLPNAKHSLYKVRLIDFGMSTKYVIEDGSHTPMKKVPVFKGNLVFSSKNMFNMISTSRRDDLISLCNLMLYLLDGELIYLVNESENSGHS
jgi:serine/threonine protein kinase